MIDTEYLRFVGGPEDGKYIEVAEGNTVYKVLERIKPNITPNLGMEPCNLEGKVLLYVRRGRVMVFNS